jgi:hypothetical protein
VFGKLCQSIHLTFADAYKAQDEGTPFFEPAINQPFKQALFPKYFGSPSSRAFLASVWVFDYSASLIILAVA